MLTGRVRHMVAFALAHPDGSAEERDFLGGHESAVYYASAGKAGARP